jgi:Glycosyl transferase family 8
MTSVILLHICIVLATVVVVSGSQVQVQLSSETTDPFAPPGPGDIHKNAYVLMHYEGTERDDDYAMAARVLIHSIKLTNTDNDIVVLASHNVRPHILEQFQNDGAILAMVDNIKNPFKQDSDRRTTYKAHFEFTLNKLFLWDMLRYDRVVYLDTDNIVLGNMDEIFQCCRFCAEFMNQRNFHTGLMVIKPDHAVFEDMLKSLSKLSSYDGADQGFFTAYFDKMDSAPMFDVTVGGQQEIDQCRLPYGYNMNHIYYYERMSWYLQRGSGRFGDMPIPALTMAYPIMQIGKPWYWWPTIYFDQHFVWQGFRDLFDAKHHIEHTTGFLLRWAVLAGAHLAVMAGIGKFAAAPPQSGPGQVRDTIGRAITIAVVRIGKYGPNIVGISVGFVISIYFNTIFLASPPFVPVTAPPLMAWSFYITLHCASAMWWTSLFAACIHIAGPTYLEMTPLLSFYFAGAVLLSRHGPIWGQFIVKIMACLFYAVLVYMIEINYYRNLCYALAGRHGISSITSGVKPAALRMEVAHDDLDARDKQGADDGNVV